ncbi:MAG: hypothetical protein K6A38_06390 [Lachnospiraceae bacterium]|nr:hypothetical protein [Lachnospiraceae bacterium]
MIADQENVYLAAGRLFSSDFHDFYKDQYIGTYNNQLGLVFWEYLIMKIAGTRNVIIFQILNSVFIMLVYKEISEIASLFGMNRVSQLVILLSGLVFCPMILYSTFVYGTIPGLALSLLAIKGLILFFDGGKWYKALIYSLFWIPAIGVKENYLIFLIGAVIYFVIESIRRRSFIKLWYPVVIIILCILSSFATKAYIEHKIGFKISPGLSSWSFVAMGLDENNACAYGWFNSYNVSSYVDSGYDAEVQKVAAKKKIEESKHRFSEDHAFRNSFFLQKTVSQWNEPTFEGFWINQTRPNLNVLPKWASKLKNDSVIHPIRLLLDYFLFFVYFGTLLFVLFCPKKKLFRYLIFPIIFIGGFLFHTIWEAKSQYTFPYFMLLIPYAIMGIQRTLLVAEKTISEYKKKNEITHFWESRDFYIPGIAALLGLIVLLYFSYTDSWVDTKEYDENLKTYLAEEKELLIPDLNDGQYRIVEHASGKELCVGHTIEENRFSINSSETGLGSIFTVVTFNDISRLYSMTDEKTEDRYRVLESIQQENSEFQIVQAANMSTRIEQEWRITKEENGLYTIKHDDYHVLTADPATGTYFLTEYNKDLQQFFDFVPVK